MRTRLTSCLKSPNPHHQAATPSDPSCQPQTGEHQLQTWRSFPAAERLIITNPQLRSQLYHVYLATLEPAPEFDQHSYRRDNFNRGRGRGRGRENARGMSHGSWTPERGFKEGLRRLKRVRELGSLESEGIHEFSNLALKLSPVMTSGRVGHLITGGQVLSEPHDQCPCEPTPSHSDASRAIG